MSQQIDHQNWIEVLESLQHGADILRRLSGKQKEVEAVVTDSWEDISAIVTVIVSGVANEQDTTVLLDLIQGSCIALFQLGWEARERVGDLSLWEEKLK